MSRSILVLLPFALTACPPSDPEGPSPDRVARVVVSADGDVGDVVAGHNAFSWDLYAELVAEDGGNVFFSPFSTTAALGMTLAGAEGTTEEELAQLLGLSIDEGDWHTALGALTRDLNGDLGRGYTLAIANRLFGQEGYPFEEPFLAVCADDYDAPLEPWDFISDPEGGRALVNDWVADQTQDRIEDLLPEGSVNDGTRLVLANAIYFLADWATAFDPDDTQDAAFTLLDGSPTQVPMMHLDTEALEEHGLSFGTAAGVRLARLPYADDEVSMVLVVPEAVDGLPAVEASLSAETFDGWLAALSPSEGVVRMPRLDMEYEKELSGALGSLGVVDAFDGGTADFTDIADAPDGNLFITGVFHKAFVKVDEAGTEAAAATGVVVGVESATGNYVSADRPFLFVIRDDLTGAILFVGRVADPS